MSEGKLLDWLIEEDDGFMMVSFKDMKCLVKIDGMDVLELCMCELFVDDQFI